MLEVPVYLSSVLFGIRVTWQFKKGRKLLFGNFSYISIESTKKVDRSLNVCLKVQVYKSVQLLCALVRKFWNNGWRCKRIILSWICHSYEFTGHVYLKCFSKILFVVFSKYHIWQLLWHNQAIAHFTSRTRFSSNANLCPFVKIKGYKLCFIIGSAK